jgi:phosphoglycolate phosphatase
MAHRAGMDSVAVGYGAQPLAELLKESPKLAIERFEELCHWLSGDRNRQSLEVELYV